MIAAMKKVLSRSSTRRNCYYIFTLLRILIFILPPISLTRITEKLAMKAWINPRFDPDFGGSSVVISSSGFFRSVGGFTSSSSSSRGAKSPKIIPICDTNTIASRTNVRNLLGRVFAILWLRGRLRLVLIVPIASISTNERELHESFRKKFSTLMKNSCWLKKALRKYLQKIVQTDEKSFANYLLFFLNFILVNFCSMEKLKEVFVFAKLFLMLQLEDFVSIWNSISP